MRIERRLRTLALVAVLAIALGLALGTAGCAKKSAQAEASACVACGARVEADQVRTIDGQTYCQACAAKIEAAQNAEQGQVQAGSPGGETAASEADAGQGAEDSGLITCSVCGMKMTAAETKMIDGKPYCVHCVPAESEPKAPAGGQAGHGG